MRVRRLLGGAAAFKLIATPVIMSGGRRADSFQVPISGSCYYVGSTVHWYFSDDGTAAWTPGLKLDVRTAIAEWSKLRREGGVGSNAPGSSIFDPVEVAGPEAGAFKLIRQDGAGGGSTDCNTDTIKFDVGDPDYKYVGAHEIAHAFGLRHTGTKDQLTSYGGVLDLGTRIPLMGLCTRPAGIDYWKGRSDDQASAWYKASSPSIAFDGGFESISGAPAAFAHTGGSTLDSAYSYSGDRSMRVPQNSGIEQRVRLTDPAGASLTASVRYKTNSGTGTNFKLMARGVSYSGTSDQCPGHVLNNPTPGSTWTWTSSAPFGSPGGTWTAKSVTLWVNISALAAVDVDVSVNNTNTETLWVDSLKVNVG